MNEDVTSGLGLDDVEGPPPEEAFAELAAKVEALSDALRPFAELGRQLARERGNQLSERGTHPVRIAQLLDAARAMNMEV